MTTTPYASGFDEASSNQYNRRCPECDGPIESDGGERTCRECGLVIDGYGIAHDIERRTLDDGSVQIS